MAKNDRFRRNIANKIGRSQEKIDLFVRKFIIDVNSSLTEKSPVLTGRFKANWMVGDGLANLSTTNDVSDLPYGIAATDLTLLALPIKGQKVYITNSLPYAYRLETGYSAQAPAGMVGITLAEVKGIASKVGLKVKLL